MSLRASGVVVLLAIGFARAQTTAPRPEFEVAPVKPNDGSERMNYGLRTGLDFL